MRNLEIGMTKDKYLTVCEQMGIEPDEEKCPPEVSDLPEPLQQGIFIFNKLGDRVYPEIGYIGKDYSSLPIHFRINNVTEEDLVLETLLLLDQATIKKSSEELKKARKKATSKTT